jgi:hypothetical protein
MQDEAAKIGDEQGSGGLFEIGRKGCGKTRKEFPSRDRRGVRPRRGERQMVW